jgi:hypothetical protein
MGKPRCRSSNRQELEQEGPRVRGPEDQEGTGGQDRGGRDRRMS